MADSIYGVQANLKLSVDEAVANLAKVQEKLTKLKTDTSKPLTVSLAIDTSKFDQAAKKIKQTLSQATTTTSGQTNSLGMPKVADLTQISKQLNVIARLLSQILSTTGNLNTQTRDLRENMAKSFDKMGQVKVYVKSLNEANSAIKEHNNRLTDAKQIFLNYSSAALKAVGQIAKGLEGVYGSFRNLGQNMLTGFSSFANSMLETIGFGVSNLIDDAIDQERKLQQSRIGFKNMFPGQDANAMISKVRSTAAASPSLNSGDLADYINQLGAVSGGDFSTAFNATMGILKTVQYGGGDAGSQMNYIIKNVRDVMAKGKATQVDIQQFNRAMPLLQKSLEAIGASQFLKDGHLTITKENARNLMSAFAQLNTEDNPAYTIFEETAKTLGGLQEEFRETVTSKIAVAFENLGLFDALSDLMRGSVFSEIDSALESFQKWAREIKDAIDWGEVGTTVGEVMEGVKVAIGEFANMIKEQFGNTEFLKIAVKTVGAFFEGLINGATELGKFLAHIKNTLGEEGLSNLAKALGQSVTQGVILQKVLGGISTAFSGLASVLQTWAFGRFLTNNGQGGAGAGLGASVASGIGNIGSTITGGRLSSGAITKGVSSIGSFLGKSLKLAGIGTLVGGLTDAGAEVISNFNLLGDASKDVANVIDIGGNAIQYAIYGKILGPFGMLAGAALGLAEGFTEAAERAKQKEAAEAEQRVNSMKTAAQTRVVDAAVATFKSVPGNVFDERTEAAKWVKDQVYEYLQKTPTAEWDDAKIYDRFVSAYRQKLGQETMVKADNIGGFWNLKGQDVEYVKQTNGMPELTEYGARLADLIKKYNLVGYSSYETLMDTSDEKLVNEYLQTEKLNLAQIEFLEKEAQKFEDEVGIKITNSRDEISKAIEEAGTIDDAIAQAVAAGQEAWAETLRAYKLLQLEATNAMVMVSGDRWSANTATEFLGTEGGQHYNAWAGTGGFWDTIFNRNATHINNIFGTADVQEIITRIFNAAKGFKVDMNNSQNSEEERAMYKGLFEAYSGFLNDFQTGKIEDKNWEQLQDALDKVAKATLDAGRTDILANRTNGLFGSEWTAEDWLKWLKSMGYFAGGGEVKREQSIKPVFRAGGGLGVDSVPAFLQPGEFVQRASAVSTAGLGVMNALNNGDLAAAYRMIGSKISGHWNNSRNIHNQADNRRSQINNTYVFNRNRSGSVNSYNSLANRMALGF